MRLSRETFERLRAMADEHGQPLDGAVGSLLRAWRLLTTEGKYAAITAPHEPEKRRR